MAFTRPQQAWPADDRLRADKPTVTRWEAVLTAERFRRPIRLFGRSSARLGRRAFEAITDGRNNSTPTMPEPQRHSTRGPYTWTGSAALAVGPTSKGFLRDMPVVRRRVSSDLVVGLEPGWLRVDADEILWHRTGRHVPSNALVVSASDITAIELVDLGRRRAGMTVTKTNTDELWLLIDDRRKMESIISRLRYGS